MTDERDAGAEGADPGSVDRAANGAADSGNGQAATETEAVKTADAGQKTRITTSRGFNNWLVNNSVSLVFTTYQTGQLFLVGVMQDNKLSVHQSHFPRAMGVLADSARIYLAGSVNIWRLENVLTRGQMANKHFDAMFVPRNALYTGDLDTHELGLTKQRRIIFVNTKFSCLAVPSATHSFKPIWRPKFISRVVPEDRCHLNGLAMQDGTPRYVTAVSRSDAVSGWRDRRWEGGVLIDVQTNEIVVDDLSMPHSPRVHNGAIWVLDSGRGFLVRIDPETKKKSDIAFCPGFLRGLAFTGRYGIVTTSLPRTGVFKDLELQKNLEKRDTDPKCGVYIVDLQSGGIVHWIELTGQITELFDVAAIEGVRCPSSITLKSPQIASFLTIERGTKVLSG